MEGKLGSVCRDCVYKIFRSTLSQVWACNCVIKVIHEGDGGGGSEGGGVVEPLGLA